MTNYDFNRAINLLKQEFGEEWQNIVQNLGTENLRHRVGKELTSFMAFPDRGDGGNNQWRGNCSPKVIEAITKYVLVSKRYYSKDVSQFTLLDPMSGSGTSKGVADKLGINSVLYDLNPNPKCGIGNWNALKNDVEDSADLIFFHPPYHDIIKYSGNMWGKANPDDLSRCENYNDFIEKLNFVIQKLYMALRKDGRLAILVGDIRSKGEFHSMQHDMMKIGDFESFIVKGQFNCVSDSRTYKKPFIPIVTEYMLVFHKNDPFIIDFSKRISRQISMKECDSKALTWHHLIRMSLEELGGSAKLSDLADFLKEHPKAKKNPHYRERIRATVYEHKDQYKNYGNGVYGLIYKI